MTTKETNPKDALGVKKTPFSTISMVVTKELFDLGKHLGVLIPPQSLAEVGVAMMEGAFKYGRHNYRVSGVRASVYFDAFMRHLMLGVGVGENIDPDSSLPHLIKACATLFVLRDAMISGNWIDDRPPIITTDQFTDLTDPATLQDHIMLLMAWWEGLDDFEDHSIITHVLFYMLLLRGDQIEGVSLPDWRKTTQGVVDGLFVKYPNPVPAFIERT